MSLLQHIRNQIARQNHALNHENTPGNHNCQIHHTVKHSGCGLECAHIFIRFFFNPKEAVVIHIKLLIFHIFICESLYNLLTQ